MSLYYSELKVPQVVEGEVDLEEEIISAAEAAVLPSRNAAPEEIVPLSHHLDASRAFDAEAFAFFSGDVPQIPLLMITLVLAVGEYGMAIYIMLAFPLSSPPYLSFFPHRLS